MKRIIFLLAFFTALSFESSGQTVEQFSMYNFNHYLINPAAAGNDNHLDVALGYRRQWAGIKDAPSTYYASGHTLVNRPKTHQQSAIRTSGTKPQLSRSGGKNIFGSYKKMGHAVGGKMSSSQFGAFSKTEVMLTYAIHLPVYEDINLAFGLSAGLNSFSFDKTKASVLFDNDPAYDAYSNGQNANIFNSNTGTYIYSDKFYVGYSAHQILQNKLELANADLSNQQAELDMHHFILGGYNYDLNNDIRLNPNLLLKKAGPTPFIVDYNLNVIYKQTISAGINYRSSKEIVGMFSMRFNHLFKAGYAFDFTTSELSEQASGSHEIFIGLTIF